MDGERGNARADRSASNLVVWEFCCYHLRIPLSGRSINSLLFALLLAIVIPIGQKLLNPRHLIWVFGSVGSSPMRSTGLTGLYPNRISASDRFVTALSF